jgi:N-carbamoyl-L-amino-acid hydrolase
MSERRDALCAAAEIVLAVEESGIEETPHQSVATSANLSCRPGAMNVVPGEATVLVDVRGIDQTSINRIVASIERKAAETGRRRGVEVKMPMLSRGTPTLFQERIIRTLAHTVRSLGHEPLLLSSGAGHDAQCLAGMAPTGMLFVPSVGGLSHCAEEYTRPEDVITGTRALAACWSRLAENCAEG